MFESVPFPLTLSTVYDLLAECLLAGTVGGAVLLWISTFMGGGE